MKTDILSLDLPVPESSAREDNATPEPRLASGTGGVAALERPRLAVRYEDANEFVVEYADNMSRGGLFLRGDLELERLSEIDINLTLPGLGSIVTRCRVVHSVPGGVGLDLSRTDHQLHALLHRYLVRLGARREVLVACEPELENRLSGAGYQVVSIPSAADLVLAFSRGLDIVAVAVHEDRAHELEETIPSDFIAAYRDFDQLLVRLDRCLGPI